MKNVNGNIAGVKSERRDRPGMT